MARLHTSLRTHTSFNGFPQQILALLLLVAFPLCTNAQVYGSRSHTMTISVATINNVTVSSGSVSLTISAANVTAGQDAMGPVVNTATSLLWGFNSSLRKVTVATNLAAPKFTLTVLAVAPTVGTAAPAVTLSTTATDFLTNLGRSSGSCTLQYTGTALASKGAGTDTHTVTFSVAAQ